MFHKKLNGETVHQISEWLDEQYNMKISGRQLWNIFKKCIPDMLLKMNSKPGFYKEEDIGGVKNHILSLERLAKIQLERLNAQFYDELEQMGEKRYNPQTGEVEYSATNKHFNESARVYNQLVKNIIELKMSIGLVKKTPDVIEVKTKIDSGTRIVMREMIMSAVSNIGDDLDKFIQDNPGEKIKESEYLTETKQLETIYDQEKAQKLDKAMQSNTKSIPIEDVETSKED